MVSVSVCYLFYIPYLDFCALKVLLKRHLVPIKKDRRKTPVSFFEYVFEVLIATCRL